MIPLAGRTIRVIVLTDSFTAPHLVSGQVARVKSTARPICAQAVDSCREEEEKGEDGNGDGEQTHV